MPHENRKPARLDAAFMAALSLMALLALAPRALGFAPALAGLLLFAAWRFTTGGWPATPRAVLVAVTGVVFLAAVSALWSADPGFALERAGKILLAAGPGVLLLVAAMAAAPGRMLSWPAAALATATVLIGVELTLHAPLYHLANGLPAAEYVQPSNFNRGVIVVTLLLPLAAGGMFLRFGARMALLPVLPALPVLALTESQSAQFAFLVACACLLLPVRRRAVWAALAVFLGAGILCAPWIAPWMFAHLAEPLAANALTGAGGGYAPQRLEIWDAIARLIHERPLSGYGVEAMRHMDSIGMAGTYNKTPSILHPHNFALQFWVEYGVAGALACLALCGLALRALYARREHPATRFALAAFAATLSVGAMGYGIWQGWWLGLLMLQLAWAAALYRPHQNL